MKLIYYAKPYLLCRIHCVVPENLFTQCPPPTPHWGFGNCWGEGVLETIKKIKEMYKAYKLESPRGRGY